MNQSPDAYNFSESYSSSIEDLHIKTIAQTTHAIKILGLEKEEAHINEI